MVVREPGMGLLRRRFAFDGATVIVTGATAGIGRELTRRLAAEGATVVATGRRYDRLERLAAEVDGVVAVAGDVTDADDRTRVIEAAVESGGGGFDLLINNAGAGAIGPFAEASPDRLRRVMEVNFFAAAELARQALPILASSPRGGVLCNVGSVLGHTAVPDKSEYCAAKFAMHGWNDSLRAEWTGRRPGGGRPGGGRGGGGVTVTLVSPSTTRSEFFGSLIETDSGAKSRSVGSWSPEEVAAAIVRAVERRRREVVLSLGGKALVYADRLVPGVVSRVLARARSSPATVGD